MSPSIIIGRFSILSTPRAPRNILSWHDFFRPFFTVSLLTLALFYWTIYFPSSFSLIWAQSSQEPMVLIGSQSITRGCILLMWPWQLPPIDNVDIKIGKMSDKDATNFFTLMEHSGRPEPKSVLESSVE